MRKIFILLFFFCCFNIVVNADVPIDTVAPELVPSPSNYDIKITYKDEFEEAYGDGDGDVIYYIKFKTGSYANTYWNYQQNAQDIWGYSLISDGLLIVRRQVNGILNNELSVDVNNMFFDPESVSGSYRRCVNPQCFITGDLPVLPDTSLGDNFEPMFDVLEEVERLKILYSYIDDDIYSSLEFRLYPYNFKQVDFEPTYSSTGLIPLSDGDYHYIDSRYDWFSIDTYYGIEVVGYGIGVEDILWSSMPFTKYCALPADDSEYIFDVSPVYKFDGAKNNNYVILTWYLTNKEDLRQELYYRQTETSAWILLELDESDIKDMSYLHKYETLPYSYRIRNVDKGDPRRVSDYSYFNPAFGGTMPDGDPEWNEGGEVTTDNFFDWIIGVLNGIVNLFSSFINLIFELIRKTGQVGDLFSTIFKFMPSELVSIIIIGFSISILFRVFGR